MKQLAILVIATMLATAYAGADASQKAHHRHGAANRAKAAPTQGVDKPLTRLPVSADEFRA